MPNVKITDLTAATALTGTEQFEVVQSASSKRATAQQIADYARLVPVNNQTGTSYTLAASDAGKVVRASNSAAITHTVPTNATAAIPVGNSIAVRQVAAGQVTLSPAGGVTLNTPAGYNPKTRGQGSTIMLHKVDTDAWDVTGDLATIV